MQKYKILSQKQEKHFQLNAKHNNVRKRTKIDFNYKLKEYIDVKERTAKGYIKFMREKDIILKDPSKTNYFVIGHG